MIRLRHTGVFVNHLKQGILPCLAEEGYRELLYLTCIKLNISLITPEKNALDCLPQALLLLFLGRPGG